jgi:hypothetical protein
LWPFNVAKYDSSASAVIVRSGSARGAGLAIGSRRALVLFFGAIVLYQRIEIRVGAGELRLRVLGLHHGMT